VVSRSPTQFVVEYTRLTAQAGSRVDRMTQTDRRPGYMEWGYGVPTLDFTNHQNIPYFTALSAKLFVQWSLFVNSHPGRAHNILPRIQVAFHPSNSLLVLTPRPTFQTPSTTDVAAPSDLRPMESSFQVQPRLSGSFVQRSSRL
jgi:hypothetical protein